MKYLIDFENVANNGFDGLGELRPSDELLIFYSEQHSTISITVHQALEKSLVHKSYMPVKTGGKNALDFQLVTWLGHEISQHPKEQFVIVSKDTGFDVVVDFWQKRGISLVRSRSLKGTKSILKKMKNILPEQSENVAEESALDKCKLGRSEATGEASKKDSKEALKEKKSRDGKKKKGEKNKKQEPEEPMMTDAPEETESKPTRRRRKSGKGKQQKTEDKSDSRDKEKEKQEKPSKRKPSKKKEEVSEENEKKEKQKRRRGSRRGRRKSANAPDAQLSE